MRVKQDNTKNLSLERNSSGEASLALNTIIALSDIREQLEKPTGSMLLIAALVTIFIEYYIEQGVWGFPTPGICNFRFVRTAQCGTER